MQRARDTTRRGELSEFEIIAALLRAGRVILRPLSADFGMTVIDNEDGTFARVQRKTEVLRTGDRVSRLHVGPQTAARRFVAPSDRAFAAYRPTPRARSSCR